MWYTESSKEYQSSIKLRNKFGTSRWSQRDVALYIVYYHICTVVCIYTGNKNISQITFRQRNEFPEEEKVFQALETRMSCARDTLNHLNLLTESIMHKHPVIAHVYQLVTPSLGLCCMYFMRTTLLVYYISPITRILLLHHIKRSLIFTSHIYSVPKRLHSSSFVNNVRKLPITFCNCCFIQFL